MIFQIPIEIRMETMPASTVSTMKAHPLVSIITPSFNAMPFLVETIESVRLQDYPRIEHIVIDGNSTDGTKEFLQRCPNLIWISEPDRGQSDALNKGFRWAGGEIIGWLNADDTYQPGAISTAVNFLVENSDTDLVYSDIRIIDETSQPVGLSKSKPFELEKLLFSNYIKQPTVFMRRRVLEQLKGVNENLHYVMDRELWLRAGLAGFKMCYLKNMVSANFRLVRGTKTYEFNSRFRLEWLHVLQTIFELPELMHISPVLKKNALRKNEAQYYMVSMIEAIDRKDRKSMLSFLIKGIQHDPSLVINQGTWLFVARGILGLKNDRLRRFRKNGHL